MLNVIRLKSYPFGKIIYNIHLLRFQCLMFPSLRWTWVFWLDFMVCFCNHLGYLLHSAGDRVWCHFSMQCCIYGSSPKYVLWKAWIGCNSLSTSFIWSVYSSYVSSLKTKNFSPRHSNEWARFGTYQNHTWKRSTLWMGSNSIQKLWICHPY